MNDKGFSAKELLMALGGVLLLCVLAWPAFHYLREQCSPINHHAPANEQN